MANDDVHTRGSLIQPFTRTQLQPALKGEISTRRRRSTMTMKPKSMISRIAATLLLVLVVLFAGAPGANAQFDSGSFVGTVADASGAAIPQATVTITNIDTGIVATTKADASGHYE